jgi:2-methylfumaryl-CoA isomerase
VDFACSDGQRVMVVELTEGQWAALRSVTGTGEVFAALELAREADLTLESERYRLRETIAAVLRPWFVAVARGSKTVADELDAARVLWGRYQGMTDVVTNYRVGRHAVLADLTLPTVPPGSPAAPRCGGTASTARPARLRCWGGTPRRCSPRCWAWVRPRSRACRTGESSQ